MHPQHEPDDKRRAWYGSDVPWRMRVGLLPRLDWRFSLILPIAVLLLIATVAYQAINQADLLQITVTDHTTGKPIEGARVSIGATDYLTDADGRVRVERPKDDVVIRVQASGYQSVSGPFTEDSDDNQVVPLPPAATSDHATDEATTAASTEGG